MPISYGASVKNGRMIVVRDALDGGASLPGKLEIGTTGFASILVTVTLNDPCGTVSADVLTLAGFPKTVAASATGSAAVARYRDGDNVVVASGLTVGVTGSGADIIIDSTTITSGNNVTVNSASITHAA